MKSEEQIKKDLIRKLREQADRLEKGDSESIFIYKTIRQQIPVLEDVLELNLFNDASEGTSVDIYKNRRD